MCKNRNILTRIGTDSMFAEVYLIDDRVLKVMPYMFVQPEESCLREYQLARRMAAAFPTLFVKAYEGKRCDIMLDQTSIFYEDAHVYSAFHSTRYARDERCQKRLNRMKLTGPSLALENVQRACPKLVFNDMPIDAFVITFEEMRGDLGQISVVEEIAWTIMESSIRAAIQRLGEMHIVHNDLHVHNVLVGGNWRAQTFKVHDFGKAEERSVDGADSDRDAVVFGRSLIDFATQRDVTMYGAPGAQAEQCIEVGRNFLSMQAPHASAALETIAARSLFSPSNSAT